MIPPSRARNDRLESLRDLFGAAKIAMTETELRVDGRAFPIIDDVIVLLEPAEYTPYVRDRLGDQNSLNVPVGVSGVASDVQFSFGEEWRSYGASRPEYEAEFRQYFDLVDVTALARARVCDLGCGAGRWSVFLARYCRELVLVDFSDAIFVARRNLEGADNCLFFMGDLERLPFRQGFADFLFSLGVLHHLPTPCLAAVERLAQWSPECLIYLYYSLDNRPAYYRSILNGVTVIRRLLSQIHRRDIRRAMSWLGVWLVYMPLIALGHVLNIFGRGSNVPLFDVYRGKGWRRIEQDVYDRFFTSIEQRVSKDEIMRLARDGTEVIVSSLPPYWHFLVRRQPFGAAALDHARLGAHVDAAAPRRASAPC